MQRPRPGWCSPSPGCHTPRPADPTDRPSAPNPRVADRAVTQLADWLKLLDKIFDDLGGWEVQNLLTVASLMTRAAVWRRESRGTHCRIDFPMCEPAFECHALWRIGRQEPELRAVRMLTASKA